MPTRGGRSGAFVSPYQINVSYGSTDGSRPAGSGADWFGPLAPMAPVAPAAVAGRQWDFPSGFNLNVGPRAGEAIGFSVLRGLAESYDLLRLLIETRKDQAARVPWSIAPRAAVDGRAGDPRLAAITAFLRRPDGAHPFGDWLRMILEDLFVIDAPALYMRRDRGGRLIALLPLDGATIKPVLDDWGRAPQPYAENGSVVWPTAYQQILKGMPAIDYSARDLLYRPRNPRTHRAYGFSPVEQIVTSVNIALRRQLFTLEYFTSGNIPDSLIGVPESWTPDQIASYQTYWDAYIEGDLGARRKAKFVPGGVAKTFIQTKEPDLKSDFDEWLARIACFAFSISPQPFVRELNRASAQTQKESAQEDGLAPILVWIKELLDDVIAIEFGAPDLAFVWGREQPIDASKQATILSTYVQIGVLTINEARAQLGLAPLRDLAAAPAADRAPVPAADGARRNDLRGAATNGGLGKYARDQPRVPAGSGRASGQWTSGDAGGGDQATSGASARTPARLHGGAYRPGGDRTPRLTLVQEDEPEREEGERTLAETALLDSYSQQMRAAIAAVRERDPDWRPPDLLAGRDAQGRARFADELANIKETIAAARARIDELRREKADIAGEASHGEKLTAPPVESKPPDKSNGDNDPIRGFDPGNLESKLKKYALDPDHPKNRGKADWFKNVLGIDQSNWKDLADQIYFDETIAKKFPRTRHGQPYEEILPIRGANGRIARVTFGFLKEDKGVVRVTTVYGERRNKW